MGPAVASLDARSFQTSRSQARLKRSVAVAVLQVWLSRPVDRAERHGGGNYETGFTSFNAIFRFSVATFYGSASFAGALTWERGGFGDCGKICRDRGSNGVFSGTYSRTGQKYWICAANFEGFRPGYNLETLNDCSIP